MTRLYVGTVQMDSCACPSCGARWDEDVSSGAFRDQASRASVVLRRQAD